MSILTTLGLLVTAALLTIRLLGQTELWQRKEYRIDRLWSLLRTNERWTVIKIWQVLVLIGLVITWIIWYQQGNEPVTIILASGLIAVWAVGQLVEVIQRGLYRPQLTAKGSLVLVVGLLLVISSAGLLWRYLVAPTALLALTTIMGLPVPMALAVWLVNMPTNWRKQQIIKQATIKRRKLKHMRAVGITGSYGKTSTKFFAQQLLHDQADIIFSKEHRNSVLVIAQDILQQVPENTRSYVAEMGAYRRGEIAELCALVQPRIGVLTAIGNQHLALFGSQEAIIKAKWELIDSLPADGVAILNADDQRIKTKSQGLTRHIVWYSTQAPADVYIAKVAIKPECITGELHIHDFSHTLKLGQSLHHQGQSPKLVGLGKELGDQN